MTTLKNKFFFLIIISTILFFSKWGISFILFPNEDITLRVINESLTDSYFHYVKVLSDFNFSNDYSSLSNKFLLSVPIGSVIFHSLLYKIIGIYSFLFLELIFVFLFLYLFSTIFHKLNFTLSESILFSVFLYSLTIIFNNFNFGLDELNAVSVFFFSLSFPRPFVTNLYVYFLFYFLVINYDKEIFKKINIYFLGILFALILTSSFFFFLPLLFLLLFFIFKKYKINEIIKKIIKFRIHLIISLIIFLSFTLFFLYLVESTNSDYSVRMGIIPIELKDKIFLINYYFFRILEIKNFFFLIAAIALFIIVKKFLSSKEFYIIEIFFINFLLSIINPFIFIMLSNKIAFLYHFDNFTIISIFIYFFMIFLYILKNFLFQYFVLKTNFVLTNLMIIALILLNVSSSYSNFKNLNYESRINKSQIGEILRTKINNNCKILNFNNSLMTYTIFMGFNDLIYLNGTFAKRSDKTLENNLINALKILNFNLKDLENFMQSNYDGWRLKNSNMQQLFWQKYQANPFYTFKKSKDFEKKELKVIMNSSPVIAHQFAIPNFEKERFLKKFSKNVKLELPDYIIIDKAQTFWSKGHVSKNMFVKYFENENYIIFSNNSFSKKCT